MPWKCTRNASTSQPLCEELFLTRDHVILYLLNSVNLQNNCFWEVLFFFLYGVAKWSSIWAWRWRLHESSLTLAFSCLCVNCHCLLAVVTAEVHITDLHVCLSLEEAFSRTSSQNVLPLELPSGPIWPWIDQRSYIISWWYLETVGQRTWKEKGFPKECCVDLGTWFCSNSCTPVLPR